MHVVVTGAGGFIGQGLTRRLLHDRRVERLTLIDRSTAGLPPASARVQPIAGDFGDAAVLERALQPAPLWVFHLASVPGALAEREPALGWQVNLLAPLALSRRLAALPRAPRLVFASSVAVYGALGPGDAHEDAPLHPALSYGAHKRMTEVLLADLARRGEVDAVSLRLPGIVARPASDSGHGSAFMSLIFHKLAAAEAWACPVSPGATAWWMSLQCCVDNLLHAAALPASALPPSRTFQLPVLHAAVQDVAAALVRRHGEGCDAGLRWAPEPRIEALFGRQPPLHTPAARAAGFTADADVDALVSAVAVAAVAH